MDDQRIGRVLRALRRRLGWRQRDLAMKAGCSQSAVSEAERGHLPEVKRLRAMLAAVDASLVMEVRWRAGALDRLLDEDHAALVSAVTGYLGQAGWDVRVEVTYNEYGDRGSIDILAFHAPTSCLLVVEVKTEITAIEETLRKIDEKVRLAPGIAKTRFGWEPRSVSRLLVLPELSTARRRVGDHKVMFARVLPLRGPAIKGWIARPTGAVAALWFLPLTKDSSRIQRRGGRSRVRRPEHDHRPN